MLDSSSFPNADHSPRKKILGRPKKEAANSFIDMEQHILLHAKTLFRRKGYTAVSVNDIVESAGITKPTLYYYFKGKEDLYAAVLVAMVQHGGEFIGKGITSDHSLRDNLYQLAEGYFTFSPTSMTAMMRDVSQLLSEGPALVVNEAFAAHILQPFVNLFQNAMNRGEIAQTDPTILAQIFASLLDTLTVTFSSQYGRRFEYRVLAHRFVDVFLDGIIHAPPLVPAQ